MMNESNPYFKHVGMIFFKIKIRTINKHAAKSSYSIQKEAGCLFVL